MTDELSSPLCHEWQGNPSFYTPLPSTYWHTHNEYKDKPSDRSKRNRTKGKKQKAVKTVITNLQQQQQQQQKQKHEEQDKEQKLKLKQENKSNRYCPKTAASITITTKTTARARINKHKTTTTSTATSTENFSRLELSHWRGFFVGFHFSAEKMKRWHKIFESIENLYIFQRFIVYLRIKERCYTKTQEACVYYHISSNTNTLT